MSVFRRKCYGTRSHHELFISYGVCQPPVPLYLPKVLHEQLSILRLPVPAVRGGTVDLSSLEVLVNRQEQALGSEGARVQSVSSLHGITHQLLSRNQNKLQSLIFRGLVKRNSMNGHSRPVSMEQPARLCCAVSEAVVLAAGPWGSEQESLGHSRSQPASPGNEPAHRTQR